MHPPLCGLFKALEWVGVKPKRNFSGLEMKTQLSLRTEPELWGGDGVCLGFGGGTALVFREGVTHNQRLCVALILPANTALARFHHESAMK